MAQYIYTMNRVSKVVPPKRTILRDISLSFFPGAKIGVLGLNGSGKSSLLRIMAGIDTAIDGEARPQPGIRIGFLPQEPELDPALDVRATVEQGLGDGMRLLQRFNAISEQFAEPMDDEQMTKLLEEQARLQDAIDASGGWELERKLEIAADALRLPAWEAKIELLSGGERRRVALCRLLLAAPDELRDAVAARSPWDRGAAVPISPCVLDDGALIGAAELAWQPVLDNPAILRSPA